MVRLRGKLAQETVHGFLSALRNEQSARLVLDMSGVAYLDSAGVGTLVSLFVNRRGNGRSLSLVGLNSQSLAVLQVSGLLKLLPVFPTLADAAATFA